MCEREHEFVDLLIFRFGLIFSSHGIECTTFSTSSIFESLPGPTHLLVLPTTQPIKAGIKPVQ